MLEDMQAKSKEEMQDEQVRFAEFSTFCKQEHAENTATIADYAESLDALDRAINVLQKQNFDRKQAADAASLLQLSTNTMLPARARELIKVFLQMGQEPEGGKDFSGYEA